MSKKQRWMEPTMGEWWIIYTHEDNADLVFVNYVWYQGNASGSDTFTIDGDAFDYDKFGEKLGALLLPEYDNDACDYISEVIDMLDDKDIWNGWKKEEVE